MHQFILMMIIFLLPEFSCALPLDKIKLLPGYKIEVFASPVPDARSMTLGSNGTVFIGSLREGSIYAITPDRKILTIARNLQVPNGVAFYQGNLYVALLTKIIRYDNIEANLQHLPQPKLIYDGLPSSKAGHYWRYLRIGPDKKLYVSIGAPCNVCLNDDKRFATIMRMNLDGTGLEIFASGIRNSLGFTWSPNETFIFSDNGRDWLGDNLPPDELNIVKTAGKDYGFPFCYGKNIPDFSFDKNANCNGRIPSAFNLPAHVAPLGITFYNDHLLVAFHGSWNRLVLDGYRIASFKVNGDQITSEGDFAKGWLQTLHPWGRPVDLLVYKDGSLLVSDDYAGVVYRIFKS